MVAQNWRSDQVGKLVSRLGYTAGARLPGAGWLNNAACFGTDVYWAGFTGALSGADSDAGSEPKRTPPEVMSKEPE